MAGKIKNKVDLMCTLLTIQPPLIEIRSIDQSGRSLFVPGRGGWGGMGLPVFGYKIFVLRTTFPCQKTSISLLK